ncbi:MAG: corrinoid protein [Gemmatimonadales bacterium]|jgi:5-methyltetrahydrofolate--homocysteine methyltransferase
MDLLAEIANSVITGDDQRVAELTQLVIEERTSPKSILDDGLIAGMNVVGERFKVHEIFLPDVLLAAKAMYAGLDLIKPLMIEQGLPSLGKVVIGSVRGDLHDIGKNLVGIMLKGAGFDVIDLGNDVPPHLMVETAQEQDATVIGMSALLTTTMPVMGEVVDLIEREGLSGNIRTIVGGAPVTEQFAHDIGATAHGFDAANAVERVKQLMNTG